MKKKKKLLLIVAVCLAVVALVVLSVALYARLASYGFARDVSDREEQLRLQVVSTAEKYLGCNEEDGSHRPIVDRYNSHEPLAQGYTVTYTDSWCATFVSSVAIEAGLTDIIPTECGCQRQIGLFQDLGRWVEEDGYVPLPGDIVYYTMKDAPLTGDNTGWSDHVGIVVGTNGPFLKVIEGNHDDQVDYQYIWIGHPSVRGYGVPDYPQ